MRIPPARPASGEGDPCELTDLDIDDEEDDSVDHSGGGVLSRFRITSPSFFTFDSIFDLAFRPDDHVNHHCNTRAHAVTAACLQARRSRTRATSLAVSHSCQRTRVRLIAICCVTTHETCLALAVIEHAPLSTALLLICAQRLAARSTALGLASTAGRVVGIADDTDSDELRRSHSYASVSQAPIEPSSCATASVVRTLSPSPSNTADGDPGSEDGVPRTSRRHA